MLFYPQRTLEYFQTRNPGWIAQCAPSLKMTMLVGIQQVAPSDEVAEVSGWTERLRLRACADELSGVFLQLAEVHLCL